MDLRSVIRDDVNVRAGGSMRRAVSGIVRLDGTGAVLLFRVSQHLYTNGHRLPAWILSRIVFVLWGAELHPAAVVGPGLGLAHTGGIIIGAGARVGSNLEVFGGVTIGSAKGNWPTIGDDVQLYTGCCVLGGITVGDGARIGANAVVTQDVPAGATVSVQPVRVKLP